MNDVPNTCQIHGLPLIKVVRRIVKVEAFDPNDDRWKPYRIPPELDREEYLCRRCDNLV